MAKVQVGLVQMSCTSNKQENLDKAIVKIREIAAQAPRWFACKSFLPRYISVMLKITKTSNWQKLFPARQLMYCQPLRKN